ncbi:Septal ring factor EnvC, activator of murein hydrolases AmiA and AmiB [Chryseolinea serpens]|uniref:Septal ring factor EnvC, activator of murein hydrolases AmiA and AmiB n=1 Tax=Chryseolinea serpens TaxID=947013 RepID=A0A1M5NJZ2_9BACT|nr:peptidoglycan DD-metalloendopeptidase family protein [Chryseolinea serpens]SHG89765.1 Septal ring factor EnvC, activator of murein hydrolases AmiA and AmiB [Chryseolinea serpens]
MNAGKGAWLFLIFGFLSFSAMAQKSKAQLQKEKQQNLEKIKEVEKIIEETSAQKKNSLGELTALNQRVREQEKLVGSIKGEVNFLDSEISDNNDIIVVLEEDLDDLKKEYSAMLFAAQKANNSTTRLTFLFSAKSFDQLVMRLRYMDQYAETRQLQAEQITKVQEELSGHVAEIRVRREEKNKLLNEEQREGTNLISLKQKQNSLVKSLEKEEKKLRKDLEETKKAVAKLDKLIEDLIKEEMERAARSKKSEVSVTLSNSFEENRNKFMWPVSSGFVSQRFGRQNHSVLKGVVVQNNGVNIQTQENEKVKSIFEGEVRRVAFIQGLGSTVIIKHGEYLTVYAGLKEVFVRSGQKVTTNQEIGKVLSNNEGVSELRFQIFKNTTALDPSSWLKNM